MVHVYEPILLNATSRCASTPFCSSSRNTTFSTPPVPAPVSRQQADHLRLALEAMQRAARAEVVAHKLEVEPAVAVVAADAVHEAEDAQQRHPVARRGQVAQHREQRQLAHALRRRVQDTWNSARHAPCAAKSRPVRRTPTALPSPAPTATRAQSARRRVAAPARRSQPAARSRSAALSHDEL